MGRRQRDMIPRSMRLYKACLIDNVCASCTWCVEDDTHFLLECPAYDCIRLNHDKLFHEGSTPVSVLNFRQFLTKIYLVRFCIKCSSIRALWFKSWHLEETETSLYSQSMSPGYITRVRLSDDTILSYRIDYIAYDILPISCLRTTQKNTITRYLTIQLLATKAFRCVLSIT